MVVKSVMATSSLAGEGHFVSSFSKAEVTEVETAGERPQARLSRLKYLCGKKMKTNLIDYVLSIILSH